MFRLHHSTTFLFSVLMQAKRHFSSLKSLILQPLVFLFFLDPLVFISLKGGGGSCRRQGKSAAPSARRGDAREGELPLAVL